MWTTVVETKYGSHFGETHKPALALNLKFIFLGFEPIIIQILQQFLQDITLLSVLLHPCHL